MSEAPLEKKSRTDAGTTKVIGTHSGKFHVDEALGCYMLRELTVEYAGAEIVRSRNPETLAKCDIVIDVGGEYDVEKARFDHHQREFTTTYDDKHTVTKLSSAGLVYKHFGEEIIKAAAARDAAKRGMKPLELSVEELAEVKLKVYDGFIEAIDAIDNGVSAYPDEVEARYKNRTGVAGRVDALNPRWNEENGSPDTAFREAMKYVGEFFVDEVGYFANSWLPARRYVEDGLAARKEIHESGRIIALTIGAPWKEHLFHLEEAAGLDDTSNILYCVFPDTAGSWRVQAVPVEAGSFSFRRGLPEPWRGVRDEALDALTGIPGGIFIHAGGFIGGHKTREGAIALAIASLDK